MRKMRPLKAKCFGSKVWVSDHLTPGQGDLLTRPVDFQAVGFLTSMREVRGAQAGRVSSLTSQVPSTKQHLMNTY